MIEDLLWGLWNGFTAWHLLLLHVVGIWDRFPVYNVLQDGGWYQFGFLIGAGSPFLGRMGATSRLNSRARTNR
jgi:hypothetical protein